MAVEKLPPPMMRSAISIETQHVPSYVSLGRIITELHDRTDLLARRVNDLIDELNCANAIIAELVDQHNLQIKEDGTIG